MKSRLAVLAAVTVGAIAIGVVPSANVVSVTGVQAARAQVAPPAAPADPAVDPEEAADAAEEAADAAEEAAEEGAVPPDPAVTRPTRPLTRRTLRTRPRKLQTQPRRPRRMLSRPLPRPPRSLTPARRTAAGDLDETDLGAPVGDTDTAPATDQGADIAPDPAAPADPDAGLDDTPVGGLTEPIRLRPPTRLYRPTPTPASTTRASAAWTRPTLALRSTTPIKSPSRIRLRPPRPELRRRRLPRLAQPLPRRPDPLWVRCRRCTSSSTGPARPAGRPVTRHPSVRVQASVGEPRTSASSRGSASSRPATAGRPGIGRMPIRARTASGAPARRPPPTCWGRRRVSRPFPSLSVESGCRLVCHSRPYGGGDLTASFAAPPGDGPGRARNDGGAHDHPICRTRRR